MSSTSSPAALAQPLFTSLLSEGKKITLPSHIPGIPSRWFFPTEKLIAESPSLRCGVDAEKELSYRQQAACFIHDLGMKLNLPHGIVNVAIVYMHRFYVFHSFRRFQRNDLGTAALFLAAKVEDMPRKLEHMVRISYALQHREEPMLNVLSEKYQEEAQKIATLENILLQTLAFDLDVEVPNTFVVKRIQNLSAPKALAFAAYHFTTDSLHLTTLCLRYRPSVIACACIYLACDWAQWELQLLPDGRPWFSALDTEVTLDLLKVLANELVNSYQRCPERLRNRRHMSTIERDANGIVVPSSIIDRSNGKSLLELHNSVPTVPLHGCSFLSKNLSLVSTTSAKRKIPYDGVAEKPSVSVTVEGNTKESIEIRSSNDGADAVKASLHVEGHDARLTVSTSVDSPKKARQEISKVDLKSYKERLKERSTKPNTTTDPNQQAPSRRSFIPDISSVNESWLFRNGTKEEEPKELTQKLAEPPPSQDIVQKQSSSFERHDHKTQSRRLRQADKKSDRSSSSEYCISLTKGTHDQCQTSPLKAQASPLKAKRQVLPSSDLQGLLPASFVKLQSIINGDHTAKRDLTTKSPTKHDHNNVMPIDLEEQPTSIKRFADDDCTSTCLPEKMPRIIDYNHGNGQEQDDCGIQVMRTVKDYDHGKVVTDYGHGDNVPQTQYFTSSDSGYSDTKAFSSSSASSYASTTVANGMTVSRSDVSSKAEEDGVYSLDNKVDSKKKQDSKDNEVEKLTKVDKPMAIGGVKVEPSVTVDKPKAVGKVQVSAFDRHFRSLGQSVSKASVLKQSSAKPHKESCSSVAGISSIVGNRLPADDVLRQAALMAEQMQKRERLEKLKNTTFTNLPTLSLKLPTGALARPMKTSNDTRSDSRHNLLP